MIAAPSPATTAAAPASRWWRGGVVVAALAVAACADPQQRLAEVIDDARACEPGDTCVVTGGTDCTCPQPVNADAVDAVEAAAEAANGSCCDVFGQCVAVDCAAFANVRCEDGRCVGD